jgi:hypothetical protein
MTDSARGARELVAKLAEAEAERNRARHAENFRLRESEAFCHHLAKANATIASLRAQSDDGKLREALEIFTRWLDENRSVSFNAQTAHRHMSSLLNGAHWACKDGQSVASHPAPSVSQAGESEPGGELIPITFYERTRKENPAASLTIGGHTMTVAEWAGLAKEPLTPWSQVAKHIEAERNALQARIDKAAGILERGIGNNNTKQGDWHSMRNALSALTATDADTATIPGVEK